MDFVQWGFNPGRCGSFGCDQCPTIWLLKHDGFSLKRMELDCPVCGKGRKQTSQPSVAEVNLAIIHNLFNDSSWCNEQSYSDETTLTTELQGWDNSTRINFVTQLCLAFCVVLTLHRLCAMGIKPRLLQWQFWVWSLISVQLMTHGNANISSVPL